MKRFAEVLRDEGIRGLWFGVLANTVYRRLALLELALDRPIPDANSTVRVAFGELSETEIDELAAFRPDSDPSEVGRRLRDGHRCFVARAEGRLLAVSWAGVGRIWSEYLTREIPLASDERCTYGTFTSPAARGHNIATALRATMARELRAAGCRRLLSMVGPENKAGLRLPEKLGYRRIGVVGFVKLGPWRRDFCRVRRGWRPPGARAGGLAH